MKPPWYESAGLKEWLLLVIVVLLVAVGIKDGRISKASLSNDKDFFDAISKFVSVVAIIIGGSLSYFRFFRGRTFREKMVIIPSAGRVAVSNGNLHWLEVELKNTGSVAVWNYRLRVLAQLHGESEPIQEVHEFVKWPCDAEKREHLIDVGESSYEHALLFVPKDVSAVSFRIMVGIENGTVWTRCVTVGNDTSKC
ncbi:MAG: hypothetical protein R2729_01805 [Bryobacteraceae bacterium]